MKRERSPFSHPRVKNANPVSVRLLASLLVAAVVGACARETRPPAGKAPVAATKGALEFFPVRLGEKTVRMQLAVRLDEMQRGLMGRRDLGSDDGMIFVYEKPQQMSFWMRNTPTPLDIGFFRSDGSLAEIHPLHPFDERAVASGSSDLRFALETHQGWYRANGIRPGAKLDLAALAAALKARGFDPVKYGL